MPISTSGSGTFTHITAQPGTCYQPESCPWSRAYPRGSRCTRAKKLPTISVRAWERHHTDPDKPGGRPLTATGDDGVIYGEAAGKLIFVEYVFAQQDLEAGVSWLAMPLDGLPHPSDRQPSPTALRGSRRGTWAVHRAHVFHPRGNLSRLGVKGGAKLDHDGGGKLDHLAAGRSV